MLKKLDKWVGVFFTICLLIQPCFATYTIIDESKEQEKYNQVVEKITPETLGVKTTTNNAEYASKSDLIQGNPETSSEVHYLTKEEYDSLNFIPLNKKDDTPLWAKAITIFMFGLIIWLIQLFWWFFTEYVPKLQKDDVDSENK